jgi:hypothetical protein
MIGISTETYNLAGARVFQNTDRSTDISNRNGERRVSRTATLDGGCVITDMGYSDGDRRVRIEEPQASVEAVDFARYIVENYNSVVITMDDGAYQAAPESYAVKKGVLAITMLVKIKLT